MLSAVSLEYEPQSKLPVSPSIPLNNPYSSPLYIPLYMPPLRSLDYSLYLRVLCACDVDQTLSMLMDISFLAYADTCQKMFLATCARRLRCKQKPQLDSARCPCPCRTLRTWPPGPNSKSGAQTLCWELCLHLLGLLPGKRSPDSLLLGACQRCSAQCLQSHVVVYSSDGLAQLGSEILQFFRTLQPTAAQKMQSLSCRHWILRSCVQRSLMRCRSFPKPCGLHAAGYSVY